MISIKVTLDSEPTVGSNVEDWGYCEDERNIIISGSGMCCLNVCSISCTEM